jgi:hypothetical protein
VELADTANTLKSETHVDILEYRLFSEPSELVEGSTGHEHPLIACGNTG